MARNDWNDLTNMKTKRLQSLSALVLSPLLLAFLASSAAPQALAAETGYTKKENAAKPATASPLEKALSTWRQGDKAAAVKQFKQIDWKATPPFSQNSPVAMREKDLAGLPALEVEKRMAIVMAALNDLKQLVKAVKQKSIETGLAAPAEARRYLAQIQECGTALQSPEALTIVKLTGKSLQKLSSSGPASSNSQQ
jgi:hypothetical protein